MIPVLDVAQVRSAEERAFRSVPEGALMQRAARGLSVACIQLLAGVRGGVVGSRVVLLVGSGNNGGDALWAGAMLAARGARVDALCLADRHHAEGASALTRAGGRLHRWSADAPALEEVIRRSHLVIDGILGIGGSGGLRADAAALADLVAGAGAIVVAVDVPSGVDADTGMVAGAVLDADVTVTFGAMKPGLVVSPGRLHGGEVRLVDIGLESIEPPTARILESLDVAAWVEEPGADAYKYRRGVVGVAAGSAAYPGAALLVTSAARHANVGMVRFLDRVDGTATSVVGRFPDVVVDGSPPAEQTRATAWACGSGFPGGHLDEVTVLAVLEAPVPVVLDAGALSVVADSATVRELIADRTHRGIPTVLTPHEGEFERLRPGLLAEGRGRLAAAREAAAGLEAVIVLKGPGTIVASTDAVALDTQGTADLGTAGSGDVLTGLVAAILAGAWADGRRDAASWVEATAAAVWLHGRAGRLAAQAGPVTATDIAASVPAAVRAARFGDVS